MKVKNPSTGNFEEVYVKALDSLPVGTEVDFTGSASDIPAGWEQVSEKGVIDTLVSETTTAGTYTIPNIENYDLILIVGGNGSSQRWGKNSMILPVALIKTFYYGTEYNSFALKVFATSTESTLAFAFPSATSIQIDFYGDRTGLLGVYGIKL